MKRLKESLPVNLPELFELAKKATPGPWQVMESNNRGRLVHVETHIDNPHGAGIQIATANCGSREQRNANAAFMADARNALPAIKKMVRELKELEQKWRQNSEGPSQDDYVKGMDFQSGSCADELRAILAEVGVTL